MPIRKLLVLAFALALAIAALIPTSALAKPGIGAAKAVSGPAKASKAGGTHRPFRGKGSSTGPFCLQTGVGSADGSGVATHLGNYTAHADVQVTGFTPPATFVGVGTFTFVAANGDELTGNLTFTSIVEANEEGENIGHMATYDLTVLGGSGRFADASGTIMDHQDGGPLFRDESVCFPPGEAHEFNVETLTGWISY